MTEHVPTWAVAAALGASLLLIGGGLMAQFMAFEAEFSMHDPSQHRRIKVTRAIGRWLFRLGMCAALATTCIAMLDGPKAALDESMRELRDLARPAATSPGGSFGSRTPESGFMPAGAIP